MKLLSVKEHNDYILHLNSNKHLTGIACPNCEKEMQRPGNGNVVLLSYPAQMPVVCFECGLQTTVYTK